MQVIPNAAAPRLHAIQYEVGTAVPVSQLVDEGVSLEVVNELLAKGVRAYSVLERPLVESLRDCALRALARAELDGDEIDAVIIITESFSELFQDAGGAAVSFREVRNRTFDLFYDLGIRKAAIFCSTYGGCMNLLQAVFTAKALVQQGQRRHVLMVAAERFTTAGSRIMTEAVSVAGDGAAACVVSDGASGAEDGFLLDFLSISPYQSTRSGGDMASMLLELFRAMKNAAADCYEACERQPRDYKWVVLGDYNRSTSLTYSKLLGFSPQKTFLDNVGRLGHIPFDPLVNLADLAESRRVHAKDPVLMFLCGPISCGALSVTTC